MTAPGDQTVREHREGPSRRRGTGGGRRTALIAVATVGVVAAAGIGVFALTGDDTGPAGSAGVAGSTSPAGVNGAAVAGEKGPTLTPKGVEKEDSEGPAHSAPADLRAGLRAVTPKAVAAISYTPAPDQAAALFGPVAKAAGGLVVGSRISGVRAGGSAVGSVAVYRTKAGLSRSTLFQDQYVVQLLEALTRRKATPRFVRMKGRVVALVDGAAPAAGWFEGDKVVLLGVDGKSADLSGLALGVLEKPQGR